MNLLIIGGGGREHALTKKLLEGKDIDKIFCAPGNAGTAKIASNVNINWKNEDEFLGFINDNNIEFVVIGPEDPLSEGISDFLEDNDIPHFGVNKEAAKLESSKSFAKEIMLKNNILTAASKSFDFLIKDSDEDYIINEKEYESIKVFLKKMSYPLVIKADGLAAGKGVFICDNKEKADEALNELKSFGEAAKNLVIEEYLDGYEISVFAFCDGNTILPMISSQDHKTLHEGGKGPNTGGMGVIAPLDKVSDELMDKIKNDIFYPLLTGLQREKIDYRGLVFAGLMISGDDPYVLEFNVRFGDPETQVILPLLENDLFEVLNACYNKELHKIKLSFKKGYGACVVAASEGYPGKYKKGIPIDGLEKDFSDDKYVIHAGTKLDQNGKILTNGGRVLNTIGIGNTASDALKKAYELMDKINFEGKYFRKDIGKSSK